MNMSENLNERYKKIIEFLHAVSFSYCNELGIQIDIEVPTDDQLNASVCHVKDNIYRIKIFPSCLNLDYKIQDITKRYTTDDLQFFWRVKHLGAFERFKDDTYREDLNNLFATIILLHIFFHECGHISAGHINVSGYMDEEYAPTRNGSYEIQEHEMVADWLSTNYVFRSIFRVIVPYDNFDFKEIIAVLKQLTVLYWLSLTIEFQIFDSNHMKAMDDFSTLTHPHPAVRLFYNIEAMHESIADILIEYDLDNDQAETGANIIIKEMFIYIASFLSITNTPIDIKKFDPQIIDCYIKLRDIPYKNGAEEKTYLHLCQLPDEYREGYEKYKVLQKK